MDEYNKRTSQMKERLIDMATNIEKVATQRAQGQKKQQFLRRRRVKGENKS